MKKHWLRFLRNSAFGFLCLSAAGVPYASAQQQQQAPQGPLLPIEDVELTFLGIEKAQVDEAAAPENAKENVAKVRKEIQEALRAFRQRDLNQAFKELEDAFKADPSLPPPNVMMARLCIVATDQQVQQQARVFLERAVASHEQWPEAYVLLGRIALQEGRLTDADLNFKKAQEYTPAAQGEPAGNGSATGWSPERRNNFLKEIYDGLVKVAEQRGQWSKAEDLVDAWSSLDPNDPMAASIKGKVLFMINAVKEGSNKDYKPAREALENAYKLAGEHKDKKKGEITAIVPPEMGMLQLFSQVNAKDEADKEVAKLVQKAETFPEDKEKSRVYTLLSQWFMQQNNPEEAGKMAVKAQNYDPESPALKELSAVMRYYGNDPSVLVDFEKMNHDAPDNLVASNFLALLLCESGKQEDKNKAVRLAELNVKLNQKSPDALSTLGWVYYRAGRSQEAFQIYGGLLQAVQEGRAPLNADTAYYMAKVIFDTPNAGNRLDMVVNLLKLAVQSQGRFKNRQLAEVWLDQLAGNPTGGSSTSTKTDKPASTGTGAATGSVTTPPLPAATTTTTGADN